MYYKIVTVKDGKRMSCTTPEPGALEYKVGEVTQRCDGYGPLTVFRWFKEALKFLMDVEWAYDWSPRREIWTCVEAPTSDDHWMWTPEYKRI